MGAGLSIAAVSTIGANDGGRVQDGSGPQLLRVGVRPEAPPAVWPGSVGSRAVSGPRERHDLGAVSHGRWLAYLC
jgi:hypothetical protein